MNAPAPTFSEDVPEKAWGLGPAVVLGLIQFFSVSQLQLFASCKRKWWLQKVKRRQVEGSKAKDVGTRAHRQWAHYLRTGEDVLGDIARIAKPKLPEPGPDLLVEYAFCDTSLPPPAKSPIQIAGIPLTGDIDLINPRRYPEGIIRVTDHKTSSNPEKYGAAELSLRHVDLGAIRRDEPGAPGAAIQMIPYAALAFWLFPSARVVELEHIITPTKAPKKSKPESKVVRTEVSNPDVRREMDTLHALGEDMKRTAKLTEFGDTEPNWLACEKYGGCEFKNDCLSHAAGVQTAMSLMNRLRSAGTTATPAVPPPPAPAVTVATYTEPPAPGNLTTVQPVVGAMLPALAGPTVDGTVIPSGNETVSTPPPAAENAPSGKEPQPLAGESIDANDPKPRRARSKTEAKKLEVQGAVPLKVYVNCIPNGPTESLTPYITALVSEMQRMFNVDDIRVAPKVGADGKEHPLAFGRWAGALASAVRAAPPEPKTYAIMTGGEIENEVANALAGVCGPGCFVRGIR